MENNTLDNLLFILNELSPMEKKGLDTSSLKIFIRNYKQFLKIHAQSYNIDDSLTLENSLSIVKSFLEDRKAFPFTKDVILFANERLELGFKDQKESRAVTIDRILGRIKKNPELKDKLKSAVLNIRNEAVHSIPSKSTKKQVISAEIFSNWAEIIKNI